VALFLIITENYVITQPILSESYYAYRIMELPILLLRRLIRP